MTRRLWPKPRLDEEPAGAPWFCPSCDTNSGTRARLLCSKTACFNENIEVVGPDSSDLVERIEEGRQYRCDDTTHDPTHDEEELGEVSTDSSSTLFRALSAGHKAEQNGSTHRDGTREFLHRAHCVEYGIRRAPCMV